MANSPEKAPSWARRVVGILLLVSVCAAAFWVGAGSERSNINGGLKVDGTSLDFGLVWQTPHFKWELPITNPTEKGIRIVGFQNSCGCAAIVPNQLTLQPGQTQIIDLTLDLTTNAKDDLPHLFQVRVVPLFEEEPPSSPGWVISGMVRSAFFVSKKNIIYRHDPVRGEEVIPENLVLIPNTKLRRIDTECIPPHATVLVQESTKSQGVYDVTLKANHDLLPGPFSFKVKITSQTADGSLSSAMIRVDGNMLGRVEVIPSHVCLGCLSLGSEIESSITLTSLTKKRFTVTQIESLSSDLQIRPLSDLQDGSKVFKLKQRAHYDGYNSSNIRFFGTEEASGVPWEVVLPVSYYGTTDRLAVVHK